MEQEAIALIATSTSALPQSLAKLDKVRLGLAGIIQVRLNYFWMTYHVNVQPTCALNVEIFSSSGICSNFFCF
jgi:hypothetical protein